jgi:hypothetical protein
MNQEYIHHFTRVAAAASASKQPPRHFSDSPTPVVQSGMRTRKNDETSSLTMSMARGQMFIYDWGRHTYMEQGSMYYR